MHRFPLYACLLLAGLCSTITRAKQDSINDVLAHYETLHISDIRHGVTRRDISEEGFTKSIFFEALGRSFDLHLAPNSALFSDNFHAYVVGQQDEEEVPVDKGSFYRGYMEGEEGSSVNLHLDHGLLTGTISTKDDRYVLEPSWRHLNDSSEEEMIAYRHSDVLFKFGDKNVDPRTGKEYSFCGVHDSHHSEEQYYEESSSSRQSNRKRRATGDMPNRLRCGLSIVADHLFFKYMGKGDRGRTINYMIGVIDRVDQIFRETHWGGNYKNFGFQIEQVTVHTQSSSQQGHYNSVYGDGNVWPVKDLLQAFSTTNWKDYCLAHLFTYQDFDKGVIGLAYVGNPETRKVGGICTEGYTSGGRRQYLNTGLSSSLNWDRRLFTEEADIVTAHEFGHNFGSEHDPETDTCAPLDNDGGKFIMYPASVSGKRPNNKEFSPCTKRRIYQVLKSKSEICFKEPKEAICGNFKTERGEECDPGNLAAKATNCCTEDCKLKQGKTCSDGYDQPCCKNCVFASNYSVMCREKDTINCRGVAYCRGDSAQCPESPAMPDGSECIERGECRNGECVEFCVVRNLKSCACSDLEDSCKFCCQQPGPAGTCKPFISENKTVILLNDGHRCKRGICDNGKCIVSSQDVVERVWNFLKTLDVNTVREFMKRNLAGTILVFSLVIWIPAACIVHRIDLKHDKLEADDVKWRDPKNKELLMQGRPSGQGQFFFRQDSVTRSSKPDRPLKYKPRYVKTRKPPPTFESGL